MKFIQTVVMVCCFFLLVGWKVFGQEASNPTPAPVRHTKHKAIHSPPPPVILPAATQEVTNPNPPRHKFEVNLYGGLADFQGQQDHANWPWGGLAGFWLGCFVDPQVLVGVRLEYAYLAALPSSFVPGNAIPSIGGTSPDMNVICFVPSLKFDLNPSVDSPVQPYVMIGAGLMNKSMANGQEPWTANNGSSGSTTITGYSQTVPMGSFTIGLPIQLPDDYKIPLEVEIETGFTSGQNTNMGAFTAGLSRVW